MRINRYLARAGVASRRASERLVLERRVSVNGRTVEDLSTRVGEGDLVEVDGEAVSLPESHTYILLNKPPNYVVTLSDPQGRPTVADLIDGLEGGVVPVGRLDAPTEGLLILTNDGQVAHRIAHPSFEIDKVYEVLARGILDENDVSRLEDGVELDGRMTAPARVEVLSRERHATKALVTIHEGRKRQIRRMFETVGHPVRRLRRLRIGPIELGDLRLGQWRPMAEGEVRALRDALGLSHR
ncbi:MAG: pseudouridine synthase [Candidatus Eisenbacteria bacterium]|nr:pseudouridine synthase [Candidatus Eisenbacteria bacterium]